MMLRIVPIAEAEDAAVEQLLDRAFGAGRRGRTAYAVREGTRPIAQLSFAAFDGAALVGTIQCWPVQLAQDDNGATAMVMVGPVAVDPPRQRDGIGHRLMAHALEAAAIAGEDQAMMLIGNPEYYGRFYRFTADRTGAWRLPGPVERHRLLARGGAVPDCPGVIGPRSAA